MGFVVRGVHSPPFSGRGGCAINKKIPFLSGADGVVSNFKQNVVRYADIYMEATRPFTNHPVCAAEERDLLLEAQPPLLKKRRGMSSLQQLSSISKLLALRNHRKSEVYAHYDHSFRNLWDSSDQFSIFI